MENKRGPAGGPFMSRHGEVKVESFAQQKQQRGPSLRRPERTLTPWHNEKGRRQTAPTVSEVDVNRRSHPSGSRSEQLRLDWLSEPLVNEVNELGLLFDTNVLSSKSLGNS